MVKKRTGIISLLEEILKDACQYSGLGSDGRGNLGTLMGSHGISSVTLYV